MRKNVIDNDNELISLNKSWGGVSQSEKISVVYATNTAIHHTKNLCGAFIKNEAVEDFHLIITESLNEEYINLGLSEDNDESYIIDARKNKQAAIDAINNADLMLGTYYVNDLMKDRIAAGKLTFIVSERIFKPYSKNFLINAAKNFARFFKFKLILSKFHYFNENVYFLLIGSHAPGDYIKLGVKKEHILQFGYFPALNETERKNYFADGIIHLLWVGRFVSWKHPEYAVRLCKYLTQKGYRVNLKIVGGGLEEEKLKQEAQGCENIQFLGGLPTEKVRKIMSESDIFLFTSSEAEGWGLVLSEAMSEGTCVIASETAGATKELIKDGTNGKIYSLDSLTELKAVTEEIINHEEEISRLGQEAQKTINEKWNAAAAVENLIKKFVLDV